VLGNLKAIVNCTKAMAKETVMLLNRCFCLEGDVVSEISVLTAKLKMAQRLFSLQWI